MQSCAATAEHQENPPTITAVILDYGQVLARSATREDFERVGKILGVGFEVFYKLWEASRDVYDRGDLTAEEYWLKLAAEANSAVDGRQIDSLRAIEIEVWAHVDDVMLDWVTRLSAAGFKTGLLSNMPSDLVAHLRAHCEWMERFAFKTFSSEVRLIKPDPAIYEHTLRGLGVKASESLFVDDREINIQAARALGMHAIQFQSVSQLIGDLRTLGFPILPIDVETSAPNSELPAQEIKFQL